MYFWYEIPCNFVTIDYGRYEAVQLIRQEGLPLSRNRWARASNYTWTPILAGPEPA